MVAGGLFFYKKNTTQLDLLYKYLAKVESDLQSKTATVNEFKEQLSKVSADSVTQDGIMTDHLRALDADLDRVSKRVDKVEATSSQSWLLAEVEYLLKTADHRILMKEDVKGAVTILRSVEALIKKMPVEDQGLLKVRVAIAKDIASLEVYRNVDVPGTYAELVALGNMIENLPLIPIEPVNDGSGEMDTTEAEPKKDILSSINDTFGDYLTIRRYSADELKELLSPEQRRNLRDSLRLSLEQAETAALRGNQLIYDKSLSKVRNWLLNHFVSSDYRVELAIKKLEKLSNVQLETQLPDISGSQQELKRYLADRIRRGEF
jgi:uroporphyrin-3 C-methyltransferase